MAGPFLVNYIRQYQVDRGVPKADAYNVTMYVMVGLLVVGFFCNIAVRPVADTHHMTGDDLLAERTAVAGAGAAQPAGAASSWALMTGAWLLVGLPLSWGVLNTVKKALALFR